MWMADLSRIYKVKVQHWVRQKWVYDGLELLKKNNKNHAFDRAIQYAKENFWFLNFIPTIFYLLQTLLS